MRLVAWSELGLGPTALVAPHPDDVAISLGGCLEPGGLVPGSTLMTVFSETTFLDPGHPDADLLEARTVRNSEDRQYAAWLSVELVSLGLQDAVCRGGANRNWRRAPTPSESSTVANALTQAIAQTRVAHVVAPAGIGRHVDHVLCREAAMVASAALAVEVILYEDLPYALDEPYRSIPGHTPLLVGANSTIRSQALQHYPSQRRCWRLAETDRRGQMLNARTEDPAVRMFTPRTH